MRLGWWFGVVLAGAFACDDGFYGNEFDDGGDVGIATGGTFAAGGGSAATGGTVTIGSGGSASASGNMPPHLTLPVVLCGGGEGGAGGEAGAALGAAGAAGLEGDAEGGAGPVRDDACTSPAPKCTSDGAFAISYIAGRCRSGQCTWNQAAMRCTFGCFEGACVEGSESR